MASAEAGRFALLSKEDFEFNIVDQFFQLVRIVVKTCLLLICFLNITIKNFYLCLFNSHIFSDFLDYGIIKPLFTGYLDNSNLIVLIASK